MFPRNPHGGGGSSGNRPRSGMRSDGRSVALPGYEPRVADAGVRTQVTRARTALRGSPHPSAAAGGVRAARDPAGVRGVHFRNAGSGGVSFPRYRSSSSPSSGRPSSSRRQSRGDSYGGTYGGTYGADVISQAQTEGANRRRGMRSARSGRDSSSRPSRRASMYGGPAGYAGGGRSGPASSGRFKDPLGWDHTPYMVAADCVECVVYYRSHCREAARAALGPRIVAADGRLKLENILNCRAGRARCPGCSRLPPGIICVDCARRNTRFTGYYCEGLCGAGGAYD